MEDNDPGRSTEKNGGGAVQNPSSGRPVVYAMTPVGGKLHQVASNGLTLCGYSLIQLVLVEEPPPSVMLCEWCEAA